MAVVVAGLVTLIAIGSRAAWLSTSSAAAQARLDPSRTLRRGGGSGIFPAPSWVVNRAAEAGIAADSVARAWPKALALGASVLVGSALLFQLTGLIVGGLMVTAGPLVLGRRLAVQMRRRRARSLPALLEQVARGLRSGSSLRQALEQSIERADATLVPELRIVCDKVSRGGALESALQDWSARHASEGLRLAVAALSLGIDAGGAHGRALDGVAATLRDRLAVDRELAALSSQARASAAVMASAPILFAAFAAAADPRTAHFLGGTAIGLACLATGLILDGIAAWWMLQLTGSIRCSA